MCLDSLLSNKQKVWKYVTAQIKAKIAPLKIKTTYVTTQSYDKTSKWDNKQ